VPHDVSPAINKAERGLRKGYVQSNKLLHVVLLGCHVSGRSPQTV
jgi:hypothetical protein